MQGYSGGMAPWLGKDKPGPIRGRAEVRGEEKKRFGQKHKEQEVSAICRQAAGPQEAGRGVEETGLLSE